MKLNKILFAFTILLGCCLFPIIAKSTKAADTESFSVLIPKNIDMKNTDSTSFSIKAKGSLNDHDMITVTADSTVLMTRIGDDEYSGTAEVVLEDAQWYGSDLNADTYAEKKGTITFFEDKAGSYTGQMLFSIEHKQSYNITYDPNGGTMPDEYPTYYYSEQGLDSLPVPTKENSKFIGWSEILDYTLGDYWETDGEGNLLVSDKYAAANSGPQPRIADGLFPLYREITFSIDEQATLNFTFEYNKYYSSLYGMAEGGEFYLYKDDVLIDKFIPEDGTSGTKDYSTLLDSGNYQIIFVGYTTYLYYTNMVGVTQRVLDFSIARENITSIPVGSTGDKDLIAIWDTAYSITYDPDGGTMPEEYPTYYYSNQGIDFLPVPAKDGNIFKGWGEVTPYEVDSSSEWVESEDGFTHVGEKQLVINFELSDSATLSFDFINQSRKAPMEYPRYSIYKDGSVIIGQNLLSNDYLYEISHELEAGTYQLTVSSGIGNECTVTNILISSEIITSIPVGSTGEKNLTAIWEPAITYSISYNLDGGTIQGTYPEFYYSGIGIDSLPVPVKDGYEFLGWRKQNEKIIELINYDENQFIVDLENVYTEFNYNSNTDSLFESTPLYCITESAETVEIKFKVNRDTNLILSVQLYENEDSNFTDAFHKEYFETVEIKGENNESLEFSLYSPIFFKKGTYTLTMKKGNASQNNLGSIALSLIAFNDYDHISTEEEGDITLNAVFKPIVSDRSAYLDYEQCISLFNYKNIIFCNEPIPGEIHLYGYYNLTAEGSPYKVVGYEIGDTLYVATLYSDVTIYAPENCAGLFSYSFELENIEFHNFDTSKTTNMEAMFGYGIITELDISGFDTSNVENMNYLFYGLNLDNVAGLENLNVSNVKSMAQTFCQASKTTPLELNWNTESLEEMQGIFIRAEIVNVDLSSWILKDGIKVESAFSSSTIDIIKTPQVIPENVDGSFDTSRTYYDSSNNYKEYSAGTFPTGINESHVLVSEKP